MSKSWVVLVCLILLSAAGSARAQGDAMLRSPPLTGARACLDGLMSQARDGNFNIERQGVDNLILDSSRDNIQMLLRSAAKCMAAAFPKLEVVTQPGSGEKSRTWYAFVDRQYAWCATPAPTDDINDIRTDGQAGPKQAWFALHLNCAVGDRIGGWYDPQHFKPEQANLATPHRDVSDDRATPVASRAESVDCAQAAVHWASTESIGTRQAYEDHLARFPTCAFATLAKVRIASIDQGIALPARPPVPPPAAPAAIAKNCPAGQVRDSDGDCVRERAPKATNSRSARTAARARPRASANNSGSSPPHTLNCPDPSQVMACATKALSTLPH
jgi:hypothetical protein